MATITNSERVEKLLKAAKNGNAKAQFKLSGLYSFGEGVPLDSVKAAQWCRKAAKQGLAEAQNKLGQNYNHGIGVKPNSKKAITWFRKAAIGGDIMAQGELGYFYSKGWKHVAINKTKAVKWLLMAAKQGSTWSPSQHFIGSCYATGEGVKKDMTETVKWYRKAARNGNDAARHELEKIMSNQGVKVRI